MRHTAEAGVLFFPLVRLMMLGIMAGMHRKTASRFFLAVTYARLVLPDGLP